MPVQLHILATLLTLFFGLVLTASQLQEAMAIFDSTGVLLASVELIKLLFLLPFFFGPWLTVSYLLAAKCRKCGANTAMACGGRKIQYRCKTCDHLYDTGARLSSKSRRRRL